MSLVKTLAKMAIGVAVAKGASSMMKGGAAGSGAGGLGGLLGGLVGNASGGGSPFGGANSPAGGGLENMLGSILGGGAQGGGLGQGGLGGLLEQIGGAGGNAQGGGLQNILGGLAGAAAGGGGLGGLLGGLAGSMAAKPASTDHSFGEVLNSQFDETPDPALQPSADHEAAAALMIRAMIQATKADGELDDSEKAKLIERLGGDVDAEEAQFVQAEMQRPVDVDALVNDTPNGLGPQVYAMSILGIDLDSQAEAQYLHKLAQGFGMDAAAVNAIHDQLGVPSLYS
ncbi:MAG: DUF533 domain-containing protein [Paracoccaceae bacterium]